MSRKIGDTNTPDRLWKEFLMTGTLDYWMNCFRRAVAYCDREAAWAAAHRQPVPSWVQKRRKEYQDLIDYQEQQHADRE